MSFSVIKRTFENDDALIAFIDLLGIRQLYKNGTTEDQANTILYTLVSEFKIIFSDHFLTEEIKNGHFDVSIFADSIVISQRLTTSRFIERIADFLLHYQGFIYNNFHSSSRAILFKDSFFSFKLNDATPDSILGTEYTSVSLCGGKGLISAHEQLDGLPMGVYITDALKEGLTAEQRDRLIPVVGESLAFIKKKRGFSIVEHLPDSALNSIPRKSLFSENKNTILKCLEKAFPDKEAFAKISPWILIHLGKESAIARKLK